MPLSVASRSRHHRIANRLHDGALFGAYNLLKQPEMLADEIGDSGEVVRIELSPIDSTPDAVEEDVAPAPSNSCGNRPGFINSNLSCSMSMSG
jgi:hypothetical protein